MSQHDMVVANGAGATVRGDINSGLQALASTNSGSSRPATAYAGQLWLDTNTPSATVWTLNLYDGADDIPVGTFDITTNVFTPTSAAITTTANTFTADQTISSSDAGASFGPSLILDRNSATPAVNDTLGTIILRGRSSTGVARNYVVLSPVINDPTNTSEDGSFLVQVAAAGAQTTILSVGGSGIAVAGTVQLTGDLTTPGSDTVPQDNTGNNPAALVSAQGKVYAAAFQATVGSFNRTGNDGTIVDFRQDGTAEGSIDVSGTTVSYNAFVGSHWGQFAVAPAGDVPIGTVISTVDELCEWRALEFETPRVVKMAADVETVMVKQQVPAKGADGKQLFDDKGAPAIEEIEKEVLQRRLREQVTEPVSKHVLYGGPAKVGTQIDHVYQGAAVKARVVQEQNSRLPRIKVSDTAADRTVYGVFGGTDGDGDIIVWALGAAVVRMAPGQKPARGDLLESNGDGCARVQADDLLRASTIAKVTSALVQETYGDGSFLVPCTFCCG